MSVVRPLHRRARLRPPRALAAAGLAGLLGVTLLAGCSEQAEGPASATPGEETSSSSAASEAPEVPEVPAVEVSANVARNAPAVPVDRMLRLDAKKGRLAAVTVRSGKDVVKGSLVKQGAAWHAAGRLEPGLEYVVRATTVDEAGERSPYRNRFRTADLTLDQQTYPSIAPLEGETVGIGMPVIVSFDVPVTDKKSIERHLSVRSSSKQQGAWHWISDNEVHWRPKAYWKPGAKVTVETDINSIRAGNGIFGQLSRSTSFTVGDSVIHRIDVAHHVMKSFVNGQLARTTPVSAGKAGFETRSGTKVIIEKFREKRMDAATTGISEDDPEYYDIEDVPYAMRVTYSGEFLHGAPWSVGSQGSANVSHGCVGMSVDDARWLYNLSKRGDVVETTGTSRQMTLTNGYGDWNASFADWKKGSALS